MSIIRTELRRAFAEYAHDSWSGWMRYLFSKSQRNPDGTYTIPAEMVTRWGRQMTTSYDHLPESEQRSDLVEADKIILLMQKYD